MGDVGSCIPGARPIHGIANQSTSASAASILDLDLSCFDLSLVSPILNHTDVSLLIQPTIK